jgi:aryl-alcohol dehydrogenase-like predicted oxidoreductase
VDENIGALDVDLTAADMQALEDICPLSAVAGPRYNAMAMTGIGL